MQKLGECSKLGFLTAEFCWIFGNCLDLRRKAPVRTAASTEDATTSNQGQPGGAKTEHANPEIKIARAAQTQLAIINTSRFSRYYNRRLGRNCGTTERGPPVAGGHWRSGSSTKRGVRHISTGKGLKIILRTTAREPLLKHTHYAILNAGAICSKRNAEVILLGH